jgi:hypothetical protein
MNIVANDDQKQPITTFCAIRVSAVGPPRIRRSSAAGFARSE